MNEYPSTDTLAAKTVMPPRPVYRPGPFAEDLVSFSIKASMDGAGIVYPDDMFVTEARMHQCLSRSPLKDQRQLSSSTGTRTSLNWKSLINLSSIFQPRDRSSFQPFGVIMKSCSVVGRIKIGDDSLPVRGSKT